MCVKNGTKSKISSAAAATCARLSELHESVENCRNAVERTRGVKTHMHILLGDVQLLEQTVNSIT